MSTPVNEPHRPYDASRPIDTSHPIDAQRPVEPAISQPAQPAPAPVRGDLRGGEAHPGTLDLGLLILRIGCFSLLLHGIHKAAGFGGFLGSVESNSLGSAAPQLFAFLVVAGQILLPIAILVGLLTRLSGLLLAVMMLFISFAFTVPLAGLISPETGGLSFESSMWYWIAGFTLLCTGAGRISLDHAIFGRRRRERELARV